MTHKILSLPSLTLSVVLGAMISVFLPISTLAAKVISFDENAHLNISLSKTNYSRLVVKNDNITRLIYPDNSLSAQKEADGSVYVAAKESEPFTLFITTEGGRHLYTTITPGDALGQSIIFSPNFAAIVQANHWENAHPYEQTLEHLIQAMQQEKAPKGYASGRIKIANIKKINRYTSLIPLTYYRGAHLEGMVYRLENNSRYDHRYKESQFFKGEAKAAALERSFVKARHSTRLFVVRAYHDHA